MVERNDFDDEIHGEVPGATIPHSVLADKFDNLSSLNRSDEYELYTVIPGPDDSEIELTPDNHTVEPTEEKHRFLVKLKEGMHKPKKETVGAVAIGISAGVLLGAAWRIKQRRKSSS